MDASSIEGSMIEVLLRQEGAAKITKIHGFQYHIIFEVTSDFNVSYVYNVNPNNEFFLQRVDPYPIRHGLFENEHQLVDFIKEDIAKFRNAANSSNFHKFIDISRKVEELKEKTEAIFLNYNIDKKELQDLDENLTKIREGLFDIAAHSEKIPPQE